MINFYKYLMFSFQIILSLGILYLSDNPIVKTSALGIFLVNLIVILIKLLNDKVRREQHDLFQDIFCQLYNFLLETQENIKRLKNLSNQSFEKINHSCQLLNDSLDKYFKEPNKENREQVEINLSTLNTHLQIDDITTQLCDYVCGNVSVYMYFLDTYKDSHIEGKVFFKLSLREQSMALQELNGQIEEMVRIHTKSPVSTENLSEGDVELF